jgi:hypothetical protein
MLTRLNKCPPLDTILRDDFGVRCFPLNSVLFITSDVSSTCYRQKPSISSQVAGWSAALSPAHSPSNLKGKSKFASVLN